MRATRTLSVRLASLGGAVALAAAGLAGSVGLVASSGPAGADTPPFTSTCTLAVFGPTPLAGAVVSGTISPNPVGPGGAFNVTGLKISLTLPTSISQSTLSDAGIFFSGTFVTTLTATGATPASQTVTFVIPSTEITSANPPIISTAPDAAFTADSSGASTTTISTGVNGTINTALGGTPQAPAACTEPAEVVTSAPIAVPAGSISSVLPNAGPVAGGSTVIIHGTNLSGPTAVTFGGTPATSFAGLTSNSVTAVAPPGAVGAVDVQVVTAGGASSANPGDKFTYTNGPIVTGVSPNTGPPSGGTVVNITGEQLLAASEVDFGSTPATNVTVNSATSITATSPAGSNVVDVTVTGPGACAAAAHSAPATCFAVTGHGANPKLQVPTSITSALDHFNYRAGYWLTGSDGGVFAFGNSPFAGSTGGLTLNKPVVGIASTPDAGGYWLVASDGGVFAFGDAVFYGSTGGLTLNKPVVGIAATPDGYGYWLVASDGGVFAFGDAVFNGSAGGLTLNKPVVGIASTPDGGGYSLVASDGGVFNYGDASFHGSLSSVRLVQPVVGIASTLDGGGYWLATADGGIFNLGDAGFYGSQSGHALNKPVVGITVSPDGAGYWLASGDGGVFNFGDAPFYGSAGGLTLNKPVVGIAAS